MVLHRAFLFQILRIARSKYFRFKMSSSQNKLAKLKTKQKIQFYKLREKFFDYYKEINKNNVNRFVTKLWIEYNTKVEKNLLPYPSFSFLQDPTIMLTMFDTAGGEWLKKQISYLEDNISKKELKFLLEEDYVGDPLLLSKKYLTSHTSIHHLIHLIKFLNVTKCKLNNIKTIVEWGGGYGNMIKILKKFKKTPTTYIMIDTPLFSCLQWLYLSTVFGENNINLLKNKKDKIIKSKVNILPVSLLEEYKIKGDLFISTWALSESSKYSQDYVIKKNWFSSKHLLLAYQENKTGLYDPTRVGKMALRKGAILEKIEFLPGNHYAFL